MPTIRISLVADGSSTHLDQESPAGRNRPEDARAGRENELETHPNLVPEHLQEPSHVRRPVAVPLFNIAAELLLR